MEEEGDKVRQVDGIAEEPQMKHVPAFRRNVLLLSAAWCFGAAAAFMQLSSTTLAVAGLYDSSVATIPVGILMASAAFGAACVPILTSKYGKLPIYVILNLFGLAAAVAELAVVIVVGKRTDANGDEVAVEDGKLAFLVIAICSVPQGFAYAAANNFRLISMEYAVRPEQIPIAVSMTMAGGILSAAVGPTLAIATKDLGSYEFAGSYLHLTIIYCLLLLILPNIEYINHFQDRAKAAAAMQKGALDDEPAPRSFLQLALQGDFIIANFVQVISFTTMGGLMSATPVSMQSHGFEYSLSTTTIVVHLMGMYLPSFWTGKVVARFGNVPIMLLGLGVLAFGAFLLLSGAYLPVYIISLFLIGVGWNLAFIASTSRIGLLATPAEKHRLHALNDPPVLASLGVSFIISSPLSTALGWNFYAIFNGLIVVVAIVIVMIREYIFRPKTKPQDPSIPTNVSREEPPLDQPTAPAIDPLSEPAERQQVGIV